MKCPVCGAADLIHDTRDITHTCNDESIVISAVTADFCPACSEFITDMTETDRIMREIRSLGTESDSTRNAEMQKLRSALLAGAASEPGQPADTEYFQSLRSAVAQGLSGDASISADDVLDNLEAKYMAQVDAQKMIDAISEDNIHEEVSFGKPAGKEKL